MQMPGRDTTFKSAYRYGFNGKEMDNEPYGQGNEYDYGFRIYNPRIGRFLTVDPLTNKYPWNSPYSFAEGDVMRSVDLDGLEKLTLTSNSFAPFDWFGQDAQGQYKGDGEKRKFGDGGTYRLSGSVIIDLGTSSNIAATAGKTTSIYQLYASKRPLRMKTSPTYNEFSFYGDPRTHSSYLDMHIYGHDEAATSNYFKIPSFLVPNIDVKVNATFTQIAKNSYRVTGNVRGDRFPADETYVVDQTEQMLFLGVSGPGTDKMTGPYQLLWGVNNRQMSTFNITINFNDDNTFKSVEANGKTYSITEWTKLFNTINPQSNIISNTSNMTNSSNGKQTNKVAADNGSSSSTSKSEVNQ